MQLKIATSIRQLILLGFFLATLPLTVGLGSTIFQIDKLSTVLKQTVQQSAQITETSRAIVSQVLNLERTAGQYLVLHEPELIERYIHQREQLIISINNFSNLRRVKEETLNRLVTLRSAEEVLWKQIQLEKKADNLNAEPLQLTNLSSIIRSLPGDVTHSVARMTRSMERKVDRVRRLLLLQAIGLVPLAIIFATMFSVLITRPMAQLSHTIRRLGAADFSTPIEVNGPEDIKELGKRLDWLRQKFAEIDKQKLAFLQHVSHELKTPLTALREGIALLNEGITGPLNQEQQEVVQILKDSGKLLQKEVEALLDFNLALTQEKPDKYETLHLNSLVREVSRRHALELRARGIELARNLRSVRIQGDRRQLLAVIDNLLSNAIKFSPSRSRIVIILKQKNQRAILEVIDSGPGISIQDVEKVFEPFYKGGNPVQNSIPGTGLGLAITHRYILLHHGSISVQETKIGTHIRVEFPLRASGVLDESQAHISH